MDAYPEHSSRVGGNHPRTSTLGGASAVPTPANNTGGGTGWGDKGFFKGGTETMTGGQGTEGSGHTNAPNASSTIGGFDSLHQQKATAHGNFEQRAENLNLPNPGLSNAGSRASPGPGTCATEDHGFTARRPGNSETLPGWQGTKAAIEATIHGQGR